MIEEEILEKEKVIEDKKMEFKSNVSVKLGVMPAEKIMGIKNIKNIKNIKEEYDICAMIGT